jgi:hypothetical protein
MGRPRKKVPVPDYLEEAMSLLEVQDAPDHAAAIKAVEANHPGVLIDLDVELAEHPEIRERYNRWQQRLVRGLKDAAMGKALAGRASGAAILRELRTINALSGSGSGGDRGPLVLGRDAAARVGEYRRGW